MNELESVQHNIKLFYSGANGGASFRIKCQQYLKIRGEIIEKTQRGLREELAQKGLRLTCHKGCSYCCVQYVPIKVTEGFIILDFLANHNKELQEFLDRYQSWFKSVGYLCDGIDKLKNLALVIGETSKGVNPTRSSEDDYFKQNVPCPFLTDNSCMIYPVRPLACACQSSYQVAEWCSPNDPNIPRILLTFPSQVDIVRLGKIWGIEFSCTLVSLPNLVYSLLTGGPSIVSKLGSLVN